MLLVGSEENFIAALDTKKAKVAQKSYVVLDVPPVSILRYSDTLLVIRLQDDRIVFVDAKPQEIMQAGLKKGELKLHMLMGCRLKSAET